MIRKLFATTAIAALMTSGALAADKQAATDGMESKSSQAAETFAVHDTQFLASDFIGKSVYNNTGEDAERVGEIGDVILNQQGEIAAVVVDAGGFLGIGEKEVVLTYDQLSWTESNGERWITVSMNRDAIENAPAFDEMAFVGTEKDQSQVYSKNEKASDMDKSAMDREDTANLDERMTGDSANRKATGDQMAASDSFRDKMTSVAAADLSADDLLGATVYGADETDIGEIGDIVLSDKEEVRAYVVNVGGFLGIGEKPVAIDGADLDVMRDRNGTLYVFTKYTQEQLESHPEYSETAYQDDPQGTILRQNDQ